MDNPTADNSIESLTYDRDATIVVNTAGRFDPAVFATRTAGEINDIIVAHKSFSKRLVENSTAHDLVETYLVENYEELGDHADEIAKFLGLSLERSVDIRVTVDFDVTLTVPAGTSVDEAVDSLSFEVSSWTGSVEVDSSNYSVGDWSDV